MKPPLAFTSTSSAFGSSSPPVAAARGAIRVTVDHASTERDARSASQTNGRPGPARWPQVHIRTNAASAFPGLNGSRRRARHFWRTAGLSGAGNRGQPGVKLAALNYQNGPETLGNLWS